MYTRRHLMTAAASLAVASVARAGGKTLLILGGTGFIGPHLTQAAQRRSWTVTHFNRGLADKTGLIYSNVETLIGDRKGDLAALRNRHFDAVIDDSGYFPKQVNASATLLAPNVGFYLYVSSISAYSGFATPNDELAGALGEIKDPNADTLDNGNYGPLKALCERQVHDVLGKRSCIVRPGYIVGPLDSTDRFTYWPVRASQGGQMLAPGSPHDPVQYIDVRDLAEWMISLVEHRTDGIFNAVTPPRRYTMGDLINTSLAASPKAGTRVTWVPGEFLVKQLGDAADFPPWAPVGGDTAAMGLVPSKRAQAAGLHYRPLATTVRDTLTWFESLPPARRSKQRLLLTSQKESDLLAAWQRQKTHD